MKLMLGNMVSLIKFLSLNSRVRQMYPVSDISILGQTAVRACWYRTEWNEIIDQQVRCGEKVSWAAASKFLAVGKSFYFTWGRVDKGTKHTKNVML